MGSGSEVGDGYVLWAVFHRHVIPIPHLCTKHCAFESRRSQNIAVTRCRVNFKLHGYVFDICDVMWYNGVVTMGNGNGNTTGDDEMNDDGLSITRNVREWDLLADVVADGVVCAGIANGCQHAWHDVVSRRTVATVALTVAQWHGVINDIGVALDIHGPNVSRLRHVRNAIKSVLRNGFDG